MEPTELSSCELGTQEYWDSRYKTEIKNFSEFGDVGEIWFGEDIVERIMRWLEKTNEVQKNHTVIDLGCGNGMLLVELAKEGFTNLLGVDYSEDAIHLAKSIAEKDNLNIKYETLNILDKDINIGPFQLVLDKGTYDAISLSENAKDNRKTYIDNVFKMLEENGFLLITSCNWTKDELVVHFEEKFDIYQTIPTPQFKFGGQVGNVVSIVVLRKRK